MSINININQSHNVITIDVPYSTCQNIDIDYGSSYNDLTLSVSDFPVFIKTQFLLNEIFVNNEICFNMVSQRLVKNTDPFLIKGIDTMTLDNLDIDQDIIFYSV